MKRGMIYPARTLMDIPLILDSYDEIFSNFDPRPYSHKALSGDFLLECRKASADKNKKIELRLFIPKTKRDKAEEGKIKKRLKEHFFKHFMEKKKEIGKIRINGSFWAVTGAIMMIISALLMGQQTSFFLHLLLTLVQPAGWFFLWEGMAKLFILVPSEKMPDYRFYRKMSNSHISFFGY